jgi:hypothetical protein
VDRLNVKPLTGLPEGVAQYIREGMYFLHDAVAFGWDMPNKRGIWSSNVKPTHPPEYYHKVPGQLVFVWSDKQEQWERYA